MLLTKLQNAKLKNDVVNVNTRSYKTDEQGICAVQPADVAALRDFCGFTVVGQIDDKVKKVEIRMPKTKDEFFDLALALGMTAADLRALADLLEPVPIPEDPPEPVTTYVAPVPPSQKEVYVPPDPEPEPEPEKTEDEALSEKADEALAVDEPAIPFEQAVAEVREEKIAEADKGEDPPVSLGMTKTQLLDVGTTRGLPVKPAMRKIEIYNAIMASQG